MSGRRSRHMVTRYVVLLARRRKFWHIILTVDFVLVAALFYMIGRAVQAAAS